MHLKDLNKLWLPSFDLTAPFEITLCTDWKKSPQLKIELHSLLIPKANLKNSIKTLQFHLQILSKSVHKFKKELVSSCSKVQGSKVMWLKYIKNWPQLIRTRRNLMPMGSRTGGGSIESDDILNMEECLEASVLHPLPPPPPLSIIYLHVSQQ